MKPPTFAPIYVGIYPLLAEIARDDGYALAVHGTVSRDLDLVAVPWTEEAVDAATLREHLLKAMNVATGDSVDGLGVRLDEPAHKPHGRLSWLVPLGCGAALDLSVMPRLVIPKEGKDGHSEDQSHSAEVPDVRSQADLQDQSSD